MVTTYPLYREGNEPDSKQLEKTEVPYTFQQICDILPELDLEEAKLLQSFVFGSAAYYLIIYTAEAMIGVFMMMDSAIRCLENGYRMDFSHEAWDEEDFDEE